MTPVRIVVYASDVVCLLGCSEASAYRLMRKIRANKAKPLKSLVSVVDFCSFTGLPYDSVMASLNGRVV